MITIRGGRVVDPSTKTDRLADLSIDDGRIAGVFPKGKAPAGGEILDATGCFVTPGFVDLHVHFREPGQEGKETLATGSRAALAGGFTTVCCMANTSPVNDTALVTAWIATRAEKSGVPCKVRPIGAVTRNLEGKELAELFGMRRAGAVAFSDDGMPVASAGLYRRAMELAKQIGVPVISHCEEPTLAAGFAMHEGALSARLGLAGAPWTSEAVMVARDCLLAEETGARLHLAHLSTAASVRIVRDAKKRGVPVTAEASPHHLTLTDARVGAYDTRAKMNPPLRAREDVDALIAGLADGTIDAVATDHAPHGEADKDCEFARAANGITGLETALPVVLSLVREGKLTVARAVEVLTSSPARVLGLDCGTLAAGAAADVTVFDPNEEWRFDASFSRSRNSPWTNLVLTGRVRHVFVDGVAWVGGAPHASNAKPRKDASRASAGGRGGERAKRAIPPASAPARGAVAARSKARAQRGLGTKSPEGER